MFLLECKIGDVITTGDNYGCHPAVCIKERYTTENGMICVELLNLTTGEIYDSGAHPDYLHLVDDCQLVERIDLDQIEMIKKVWSTKNSII